MQSLESGNKQIDLWMGVMQAARMVEKSIDRRCRRFGITESGLEALMMLSHKQPLTAYRLSKMMGREHHSVVELVNRMQRKGLIGRRDDGVYVTDDGETMINRVLEAGGLRAFDMIGEADAEKMKGAMLILSDVAAKDMGIFERPGLGSFEE